MSHHKQHKANDATAMIGMLFPGGRGRGGGNSVPGLLIVQAFGCPRFDPMELKLLGRSSENSNPRIVSEKLLVGIVLFCCGFRSNTFCPFFKFVGGHIY